MSPFSHLMRLLVSTCGWSFELVGGYSADGGPRLEWSKSRSLLIDWHTLNSTLLKSFYSSELRLASKKMNIGFKYGDDVSMRADGWRYHLKAPAAVKESTGNDSFCSGWSKQE